MVPDLELRQLRYFIAVMEDHSFRRAAARLYISQPSLSSAITEMERRLGTRLLDRDRHHVAPTEAGRILLAHARRAVAEVDEGVRLVCQAAAAHASTLHVAYAPQLAQTRVPEIPDAFRRQHGGVRVVIQEWSSVDAVEALRRRSVDVAFAILPEAGGAIARQEVAHLRTAIVLPAEHRLAAALEVPLEALAGERLIVGPRRQNPPAYDYFLQACRLAGFTPRINPIAGSGVYTQATLARTVAADRDPAVVLHGSGAGHALPGVVARPIADFSVPLSVAWRDGDDSPLVLAFRRLVAGFEW